MFILQRPQLYLWSLTSTYTTTDIYSKIYTHLHFQSGMANSHFTARIFEFGDFEQTQNGIVFFTTSLETAVPRVNTRKGIQAFRRRAAQCGGNTKRFRIIQGVHIRRQTRDSL